MPMFITQTNFETMLNALATVPPTTAPAVRTLTYTLPVFLDPLGTTPRRETRVQIRFDEVLPTA